MDDDVPMIAAAGDALPPHLLNEKNRELTGQVQHYDNEGDRLQREVDDHKDRLKFMVEHLANVKAEIINTQQLHEAKRREIETEDHMAQLAERERGRSQQQLRSVQGSEQDLRDQIDALQNRIFQGNLKIDEYKAAMNYNQEELEQWDIARRQKEEDGEVMDKYQRQDVKRLRQLDLQVQRLTKDVQAARNRLETEVTETRAAQIELDKTAADYQGMHKERKYLVDQWADAVKAMHRRDGAIEAAEQRYAEGKEWIEKREKQLKSRREFHEVEGSNNRELEVKISQEERVASKYRDDQGALTKQLQELDDEVEVVRNTLAKAVREKNRLSVTRDQNQGTLQERQGHLDKMQAQHEAIIAKLEDEIVAASDLERQNKLVADLVTETERSAKALDKETTRIKEEQYKNSQELFDVRRQQSTFLAEISGAQAQGKNMSAKVNQLDQEAFKQQELLYTIEFNVQQMERKVNRAKGERTEEEKRELQEKIEMLQKMVDDLLKQHKVLDLQVTRVTDDLRHAKQDVVSLTKDMQRATEVVLELTLENDSCAVELGKMTKVKEEALVSGDLLQLQVESLKRGLAKKGQELLGLENRREQLKLTVEEREAEIRVHHDVLRMESKTAEDERKAVAVELQERRKQVGQLRNRYEVLMGRMDPEAGEQTHAQHIVRTAKEREELQATGDRLDGDIKKAEREMKKLDKTIAMLKGSNTQFKHQFTKVGDQDEEAVQKRALEKKNKELQTIVNRRAGDMKDFMRSEMAAVGELQDRQKDRDDALRDVQQSREHAANLNREADEQRELAAKYDVAVSKAARITEPEVVSDILLLEEQERTDSALQMLVTLSQDCGPEVRAALDDALTQRGIELPGGMLPVDHTQHGGPDFGDAPPPAAVA